MGQGTVGSCFGSGGVATGMGAGRTMVRSVGEDDAHLQSSTDATVDSALDSSMVTRGLWW